MEVLASMQTSRDIAHAIKDQRLQADQESLYDAALLPETAVAEAVAALLPQPSTIAGRLATRSSLWRGRREALRSRTIPWLSLLWKAQSLSCTDNARLMGGIGASALNGQSWETSPPGARLTSQAKSQARRIANHCMSPSTVTPTTQARRAVAAAAEAEEAEAPEVEAEEPAAELAAPAEQESAVPAPSPPARNRSPTRGPPGRPTADRSLASRRPAPGLQQVPRSGRTVEHLPDSGGAGLPLLTTLDLRIASLSN